MIRYLLLKSIQPSLFGTEQPHHVGYTRVNRRGTASTIKPLGNNSHQLGLDFTAPPRQKTVADVTSHDTTFQGMMANGKAILELLTGGRSKSDRDKLKQEVKAKTEAAWQRYEDAVKRHAPDVKSWSEKQQVPEIARAYSEYNKIYEEKLKISRSTGDEEYAKIMDWLTNGSDKDMCHRVAENISEKGVAKKQKAAIAECLALIGHDTVHQTLWYVYSEKRGFRANAEKQNRCINLAENDNNATVFHEMAHHIEFSHKEINLAANKFRGDRASRKGGNITVSPLNELIPGGKFKANEKAVNGKFITPYVGKLYADGSTEVISVGLEHFATKSGFIKLLDKDPEHMHLMVGVLHYLRVKRGLQ